MTLRRALVSAALVLVPVLTSAGVEQRVLKMHHTHTNETIDVAYWRDGSYVPEALEQINRFLGDFRTGDVLAIDRHLLDLLHEVYIATGSAGRFEIISAYRSPATNEMLRARSAGVASESQHLLGKAIDVRLTDVPLDALRDTALEIGGGGVGYYPAPDFVHLDTGRVRSW
jgi:uncharacterized protein YcbK (DUF882 family)